MSFKCHGEKTEMQPVWEEVFPGSSRTLNLVTTLQREQTGDVGEVGM